MTVFVFTLTCPDRIGLVSDAAGAIAKAGGNIVELQQHIDVDSGTLFLRAELTAQSTEAELRAAILSFMGDVGSSSALTLRRADRPKKTVIMVSRFGHCLGDLLYRIRNAELNMEVAAVIANHSREEISVTSIGTLPFHHLPVDRTDKAAQEAQVKKIIEETDAELVILARYMQILSDDFSQYLSGRCINIHHSFLPSFKGAKPYQQAHARGVKMIGATAHFVTGDLDEGPIIAQGVERINHADSADDLIRKGRDIERQVLADAVLHHLQDRVLINGVRTVVFRK